MTAMIKLRHQQPSLWHRGLAEDIEEVWEPDASGGQAAERRATFWTRCTERKQGPPQPPGGPPRTRPRMFSAWRLPIPPPPIQAPPSLAVPLLPKNLSAWTKTEKGSGFVEVDDHGRGAE